MRPEDGTVPASPTIEKRVAALAAAAHGVVTRRELLAAGLTAQQIKRRAGRGTLIAVHRGVYRVGHLAPSREAHYVAAVKACGPDALLAGPAAAHLWGLIRGAPPIPEVISPNKRRVNGVVTHRSRHPDPRDAGRRLRIPVTTVPRTLVDLAASLPSPP